MYFFEESFGGWPETSFLCEVVSICAFPLSGEISYALGCGRKNVT